MYLLQLVRVVYRGYYYAYAANDASSTNAHVGSRLAFRGRLVKAESVEAYKALSEIA